LTGFTVSVTPIPMRGCAFCSMASLLNEPVGSPRRTRHSQIVGVVRAPVRGELHSAHEVDDEKKDQNGSKNAATDVHVTLR